MAPTSVQYESQAEELRSNLGVFGYEAIDPWRLGRVTSPQAFEGLRMSNREDKRQGIVHVIGPEQGFTLPGTTVVCGDSHTSTHGAFGSLAFGLSLNVHRGQQEWHGLELR
eukprot:Skav212357  [mRNA]  locus=scaffold3038:63680:67829:+ [translate_table: standard]